MKILTVSHRFYPSIGGTEKHTYLFAKYLAKRGHDVTVLTSAEKSMPSNETVDGFKINRLNMVNIGKFRIPIGYYSSLRRAEYDILHINGQRVWCGDWIYPFVSRLHPYRVFMAHGFYQYIMNPGILNRLYYKNYFVKMMKKFDLYMALTEHEKQQMIEWNYPAEKIVVMQSIALDPEERYSKVEFYRNKGIYGNVILNVGGFYENKRIDMLIDAVAKSGEKLSVVVIGKDVTSSPYNRAYCINLAKKKNIPFFTFENLSNDELASAYSDALVMVHTATFEGLGIIFFEALKFGIPFVSFDVGMAKALSDEGAGIVVKNTDEMAKALSNLVHNDKERSEMIIRGHDIAKKFYADKMAEKYEKIYEELISSGRR